AVHRARELPTACALELVDRDPDAVDARERACVAGDAPSRGPDLQGRWTPADGRGLAAAGTAPGGRAGRVARGGVRPRGLFLPGVPPSAARAPRLSGATLHELRESRASMRVPDEGGAAPPGDVLTGTTARQKRGRGGPGAGTRGRAGATRLVEATVDRGRGGPGRGMAPGHLHRVPKKERGSLARAGRAALGRTCTGRASLDRAARERRRPVGPGPRVCGRESQCPPTRRTARTGWRWQRAS